MNGRSRPEGRPAPPVRSPANYTLDDTRARVETVASMLAAGLADVPGERPAVDLADPDVLAGLLALVDRVALDLDRLADELAAAEVAA